MKTSALWIVLAVLAATTAQADPNERWHLEIAHCAVPDETLETPPCVLAVTLEGAFTKRHLALGRAKEINRDGLEVGNDLVPSSRIRRIRLVLDASLAEQTDGSASR